MLLNEPLSLTSDCLNLSESFKLTIDAEFCFTFMMAFIAVYSDILIGLYFLRFNVKQKKYLFYFRRFVCFFGTIQFQLIDCS